MVRIMSLRAARLMTSIFLVRDRQILLLYRIGSTAVPDSWVGIGGHIEPNEIRDPTAAALRELHEEVGIGPNEISELSLRYVSFRDTGHELRTTYYFTANLRSETAPPTKCTEGELRWFDLTSPTADLPMPPTAAVALEHWLAEGRHDDLLRAIVMTATGEQVLPLARI
jgi:8-oxo-dGTP diphosphatase